MSEISCLPMNEAEADGGLPFGRPKLCLGIVMLRFLRHSFLALTFAGVLPAALIAAPAAESGASSSAASSGAPGEGIELFRPAAAKPDPCLSSDVAANPTRPTWDLGAATTQCGVIESDYGFQWQAMGSSIGQRALPSSIRYGLTPRLDLRWGLIGHQWQSGGGTTPLQGAGDDWLNLRYRFHEQGRVSPALALDYGYKVLAANPAKGFGSGFADHQFLFIASRDIRHSHLDFNIVGTLAGGAHGHEGAAQFGLLLTQPVTKRLSAYLEGYGGPQPGIADRYGAAVAGGAFAVRPWLVVDGAYWQAYTAGEPRRLATFGLTVARRASWLPVSRNFAPARLLGR